MIKRSKNSRQRGSQSHGWGIGKAHHKGAGNRGGRGMAGTGKRGDQKKPSVWGEKYFGKYGFNPGSKKAKTDSINIHDLDLRLDALVKAGSISLKGDVYEVDLSKIGYGKLLGVGNTSKKINIKTKSFSKIAEEKIKTAGGSVIVQNTQRVKEKVKKQKELEQK